MANLQDNIRISTQVDMQQLDILISKLTQLGVNLTSVSSQARNLQSSLNQTTQATNQQTAATNQQVAATNNLVGQTNRATQANNGLFQSLNSLTKLRSELITLFGAYSIGSFAQAMVEAQSKVESFQLGMKNLLGEKFGAKLTDDLKKFTVETPLNFENVIDYTNKLVGAFKATGASSREIQEQVTPILESLGNTAAALGGGDRLGRLIYAFTQVQATGRLMGTEVRQITETGFPLLAVMAQQSGKSVQELQKDISDGKVGFEQFQKAILSAGKEGGVFAGSMDIAANRIQGRLEKLKEQTFFALANIGDQFSESARRALNFASSIVDGLFGTENATKRTIEYIQQLVLLGVTLKLVAGYEAALATGKKVLNTLELAGNVIRTQAAVIAATAAGNTTLLAKAEMEAAAATLEFNAAVSSSTLGAFLFVIGAAIGAYELYKSNLEEVETLTYDNIKATDSDVKALVTKQSQLNATAKSALSLAEGTEGYRLQVGQLIKKYPEYFGHLDAEKASHDDIRKALFFANNEMERKIKLMVQEKLAEKLADRSADLKLQIAQEEITAAAILDKRKEYQQKQRELKKKGLQDEYEEQLGAFETTAIALDQSNKKLAELRGKDAVNKKLQDKATNDLLASQQDDYLKRQAEILKKHKNHQYATEKEFSDAIIALDKEYGFRSGEIKNDGVKSDEGRAKKSLEIQKETSRQRYLNKEKELLLEEKQTRENSIRILEIDKEYELIRINNSKGSSILKLKEIEKIEKEYGEKIAKEKAEWNLKEEKSLQEDISRIRNQFRALNSESEKKNLQEQIKLIEDKYKLEIKLISESNKSYSEKAIQAVKSVIIEEMEVSLLKTKIEYLKKEDNLRSIAAKKINTDSDEIIKKSKVRNQLELEDIKYKEELLALETKRYDKILDNISSIVGETKELFNYNDALRKVSDAKIDLANKESQLNKLTEQGLLLTDEGKKAYKEVNEAKLKSTEVTNNLTLTSYQLLYKAIETIFNGIKNSIANSMNLVADSYRESNKIFQEFVVKKREADLKNYEDDLKTRLKLAEGNFDVQLKLLEEYLTKAEQLMDERDIIDKFASDLEYLNTLGAEKNEQASKMLQELSINPLNNIKSMFSNTLAAIGRASDGLSKEQEKIYRQTISNSQNAVDKLEWQRDNTVDILDQMAEAYRDKYAEQTRIVKDETDKQIGIVNAALDANLSKIGTFYDTQGDIIKDKYGNILDGTVEYTDTAFREQLAIWNSARSEQEGILISQRNSENQILKSKYEEGKITLDEYLIGVAEVNKKYGEALVTERTKFYDGLQQNTDDYYVTEKASLDKSLADGLISREDYDVKLQTLDDTQKQRSGDLKDIIKRDRDDELAYLRTFYYDAKVFEEQRAADAILKINTESASKLSLLQAGLATTIAGIEKQKRDTILSYNSQIFEENRKLALAEAEISKAQGKAAAWKNPFTAKATIKNIEEAFNEIIAQILSAVNPFAAQRLNDNVIDNQVPVVTDGSIFFEKGTDNTSKDLKGKVVDNKGGKVAVLHPDEAVFSKANMSEMTKALGYRPSRDEVIEKFKMGLVNMKLSHSPYVIPKLEAKGIGNVDKVVSELKSVANEMRRIQTPQVIMNERGIKTYLLGVNSKIEAKMNRFK